MSPLRLLAQAGSPALWSSPPDANQLHKLSASIDVFSRLWLTHTRPDSGIRTIRVAEQDLAVTEEVVLSLGFGTLLRFRKGTPPDMPYQPPVLLVAPLSEHFATLLRETVKTLLHDHDVYITDSDNARDVPLHQGAFALDDYIDQMIQFTQAIGSGTHLVAVCQPCVAALAAVTIMAEDNDPAQPLGMTLMAGP